MPKADGTVVIDTKINSNGIEVGTKEIEAAAKRMASSVDNIGEKAKISLQKQVDAFSKLNGQYAQQAKKVDELRAKVAEYENQKIPTQEYMEIQNQIDAARNKLDALIARQQKFLELGGSVNSKSYKSMQYDIEELTNTIKYAQGELEDLENTGKAFTFGANTDAAQKDISKLAQEEAKLEDMNNRLRTSYQSLEQKVSEYRNELAKTEKSEKSSAKSGGDLNKSLSNTEKSSNKAHMGMGKMLATSILFSFVFRAISAVMDGVKEGMDNLAQYSGETNATLSSLMSSLTQLKNAFATAFSPILTAIAPAINYLISLLTSAATAVAQLIAALTGKATFVKAAKVQQDYADSLKNTGSAASSAAKEAKKMLAPFDDLVQIQKDTDSGGGGGGAGEASPGDMFEEVAVSNSLTTTLDAIKDKWNEVVKLFSAGFSIGYVNTDALTNIQNSIDSIRQSLTEIFTDPMVQQAASMWAQNVIYNFGIVAGSVASIGMTIAENLTGGIALYLEGAKERIKQYLISMFDISSETATIVGQFSQAFANIFSVFGDENGQRLTASIVGMFSEAFMGVTELAAKLGRDVVDMLLTPITNCQEDLKIAFDGVLGVFADTGETIQELFTDTFQKLNQVYDEHIAPMFNAFTEGLTLIYEAALTAFNTYILPVMQKGAQEFDEFKNKHLQPLINTFLDLAGNVADVVRVIWDENLAPFLAWAMETFGPLIGGVLEGMMLAFWDVAGVVTDVATGILMALNDLLDFIEHVFAGDWESAWEDVKNIFKNVFNGIIQLAEDAVNFIIDCLNTLSFDIPDWVPEIGGNSFGFNIDHVHLPRLAQGTVIPPRAGEFAAILGDNNREAEVVSPISAMKQAFLEALAESDNSGAQTITLRFDGSMSALARVLKPELDREAARKGTNLVIVGGR